MDVQRPFVQEPGTQGRPWLEEGISVVSKKEQREPRRVIILRKQGTTKLREAEKGESQVHALEGTG